MIKVNTFGSGSPVGKFDALPGIEYIDVETRIKWKQFKVPFGSAWKIIARDVDVTTDYVKEGDINKYDTGSSGGFEYTVINVTLADSPYTVTQTEGFILFNCDATGGDIAIKLPTAVGNKAMYGFKKVNTDLFVTVITPIAVGETIDGKPDATIKFFATQIDTYSDNTNYFIK